MRRPVASAVLSGLLFLTACGEGYERIRNFTPPPTPASLVLGEMRFLGHCARCHGIHAIGTDSGPPLLHRVYRSAHHGDAAFELAVRTGVRAHHWRFGDMPPQPQVTHEDVRAITAYVRWLQELRGIR